MKKSLKLNFFLNFIKTFCSLIFPLITFAYASRVLSVVGIGKINFAQSIVSYFTLFATLGITTYGIREGSKCRDNKATFSKIVKELFFINLMTTIIAYVLFGLSLFLVPKFQEYKYLLLINGLTIGFTALGLDWMYSALEEYMYITIRSVMFQFVSFFLLIFFVNNPSDIYIYAFIVVFSNVGSNIMNFIHARHYIDFKINKKLEIKKHIKPIFVFFSITLVGNIYVSFDTVMLGFLSNEYAVGLYSASIKITRMAASLIISICTILLPRLTYYLGKKDIVQYKKLLKKAFECTFMFCIPCCIGVFLLSDTIIILFSGKEFIEAITCAKIMSIIVFVIPLSSIISSQILVPIEKEKIHLYISIIGAATNVFFNFLFIPQLQHVGAALGTVMAESIVVILEVVLTFKYFNFKFVFKNVWRYMLAGIVMGIVILPFSFIFSGIFKCVFCICLGVLIYFTMLFILKDTFFIENFIIIKNKLIALIFKK